MDASLPASSTIAWLGLLVGLAFGAIAQDTRFCTLGAVSDIVMMGDWRRMRMWGLAMAVAILGTTALQAGGLIDTAKSIYTSGKLLWLSHVVGGLSFGVGMTLASGCGAKTLVRMGSGNLKSLVVALVLGVSAYMTLRGVFGVVRATYLDVVSLDLGTTQALPLLLGGAPWAHAWAFGIGLMLLAATLVSRDVWRGEILIGGLTIGATIIAGWYITGHLGHVPEHPETLEEAFVGTNSGRMESLSFVAPFAFTLDLLMRWSDTSTMVTFGIASALGTVIGAALYAAGTHTFRLESFTAPSDLIRHLLGAALMGFGGVTSLGCTIGQGLSGLSTLSLGSLITTLSIILGAMATLHLQLRGSLPALSTPHHLS